MSGALFVRTNKCFLVMARKSDSQIQENVDRENKTGKDVANADVSQLHQKKNEMTNESDLIKNANAAGMGAIGKNDQIGENISDD
jgi:hypothetical protein